jgi:hypothetical protein
MAHREIPPMRGPGRAIVVSLIVLILLVLAADIGLRLWTEAWLRQRVAQTLGVPGRPEVSVGGFPFLHEFAGGRIEELEASAEGFPVQGLVIARAEVRLEGVAFSQGDLLLGRGGPVEVGTGSLRVMVDEEDFNRLLGEREIPVRAEMVGPRMRVTTIFEIGDEAVVATAIHRPRLEDGRLVFAPERIRTGEDLDVSPDDLGFELLLPRVMPDVAYERLRIEEGRAVLEASLDGARLELTLAVGPPGADEALSARSPGRRWMPHSTVSTPAQRPARSSSPGKSIRVQGAHPIDA